jgi:integrase
MRGHVTAYRRKVNGEWKAVRNKWRCTIELGTHRDPATGRPKRAREVFYFEGGKKEAEAELDARMAKIGAATSTAPVRGTLGTWLDEWLRVFVEPKVRDGQLAGGTLSSYRGVVRRYLKPELGEIELKKLKAEDVTALYNKMGAPKDAGGYGVSVRTRELTHVTLRAALGKAVELGRVRVNVCEKGRGVDRPKPKRRTVTALEEAEAVSLLSKLAEANGQEGRLYLPAFIALATAMRRGEILALSWDQVKLPPADKPEALGIITVARAWDKLPSVEGTAGLPIERYRLKAPKNDETREIDIDPAVVAVLRSVKAEQAARKLAGEEWLTKATRADGSVLEWGELVVTAGNGIPWWPDSFSSSWRAWTRSKGIACRFHDLRATSLSIPLANGVDPEVVRKRAGHHSLQGPVAQWWSRGLIIPWLQVRILPGPPHAYDTLTANAFAT